MEYTILIEKGEENYSGFTVDVDGIYAAGDSVDEVRQLLKEAIMMRLEDCREEGQELSRSWCTVEKIRIDEPA